jgi:hypothetical protein
MVRGDCLAALVRRSLVRECPVRSPHCATLAAKPLRVKLAAAITIDVDGVFNPV